MLSNVNGVGANVLMLKLSFVQIVRGISTIYEEQRNLKREAMIIIKNLK